jgi:hypothetical protein
MLPKNKFTMAAKFNMATKTKFACKNYKSSFFKKKNSQKFKMAPIFNIEIFFWHLFLGAFIFVNNFKMVKFLHKEQKIIKNCCQKTEFKMAAKFKMATKTKFVYVAKKTLVRLRSFGHFDYAFL